MQEYVHELDEKPLVFLLNGELGAGKTHLVKGLAKALGITQIIKSPTYNYVHEYNFSNPQPTTRHSKLFHFDAWRIQTKEDLKALRFEEWFKPGNVIAIEWPSVVMNLDENFFTNKEYYYIDFITSNETKREIKIFKF